MRQLRSCDDLFPAWSLQRKPPALNDMEAQPEEEETHLRRACEDGRRK
jgi:hypothetical protein